MSKKLIAAASFSIAGAIALGAFGAHGLRKLTLSEDILRGFQTGVDYHLFHSGAFLVLGLWGASLMDRRLVRVAMFFLWAGLFLFSGSLYLLTAAKLLRWPYAWVGPITPIGGTLLIMGWAWLGYSFLKGDRTN